MDATPAASSLSLSAAPRRVSFREYLEAEQKAETKSEYLDGVVRTMAGVSPRHLLIENDLAGLVREGLRDGGCRFLNASAQVWIPSRRIYTYPDGAIACPPEFNPDLPTAALLNPRVIFEVLSPSTEGYDRRGKFRHYRTIDSLEDYVLISTDEPTVEVFSRPEWKPALYEGLEASALIPSVGIELPLGALYALALTVPE